MKTRVFRNGHVAVESDDRRTLVAVWNPTTRTFLYKARRLAPATLAAARRLVETFH